MDTSVKMESALLFRPWDCHSRLNRLSERANGERKPSTAQNPGRKNEDKNNQTMKLNPTPSCTAEMSGAYQQNCATTKANLLSLINSTPCLYPGASRFAAPVQQYNLKSNHCQFGLNELNHLSGQPSMPANFFSIPNLYAYNFVHNLSNPLFGPGQMRLNHLASNKNLIAPASSSRINITELEKVIEQQNLMERPTKKQRPKRFSCPHCQVSFSNNGQLKGHIRIHTGERPFVCDQPNCGKTFTRNEELTRHKRIHTGLRPFACSICNKRFGRKDHLKKHVKTHQRPTPIPLPLDPALSYAALAYSWL